MKIQKKIYAEEMLAKKKKALCNELILIMRQVQRLLNEEKKVFTLLEAAKYLKLSKSSLLIMTSCNEIKFHEPGKKLYFFKEDLDNWILSSKTIHYAVTKE